MCSQCSSAVFLDAHFGWKVGWGQVWSPCRGKQEQWKEGNDLEEKVERSCTSIQVIVLEGRGDKPQEAFKPSAQRGERHNVQGHGEDA